MHGWKKNLSKPGKFRFSTTFEAWLENLSKTGRSSKQAISVTVDSVLVVFSLWAAYSLRHGTLFSEFKATWELFVLLPAITVIIFMALGIYRWVVRSSNRKLVRQLVKACVVSSFALVFLVYILPPDRATPRSLFILYGLLLIFGTTSVRLIWQSIFDSVERGEPVAIYGAGTAGRELQQALTQGNDYRPVLFLDENTTLSGTTIGGTAVIDAHSEDLENQLLSMEVGRVILALSSKGPTEFQSKVAQFENLGIPVQTVPTHAELVSGEALVSEFRDISIADILGRNEVVPDPNLLGRCITGEVVLVTGGGGSIGSELCKQILLQNPDLLIVLDQSEENLYSITEELNSMLSTFQLEKDKFISQLCSVNDFEKICQIIKANSVSTVYHAAAYKHVPIIEAQPEQGVFVNIFGTLSVLDAAIKFGVKNFVLISTDKAVRPTNSMGASKRIAELILQAKAREHSNTLISMVRFGNVLGSSGSVVPKFKKQIENGGPVTLTDPNIMRYFMTIPEAAQLVLQASAIAVGGDVFVLDMGEPMRIEDLAVTMVKMSGRELARETGNKNDIEIVIQGLRPGEKMFEELFISEEKSETTVPKVFTANEYWIGWDEMSVYIEELRRLNAVADRPALRTKLLEIAMHENFDVEPAAPKAIEQTSRSESNLDTVELEEKQSEHSPALS